MIDWPAISRDCGPLVWRTAHRLLTSAADAADCYQDTFLSALDVSRRQEVRNWPGLLQRLATARALDILRRKRSRPDGVNQSSDTDWSQVRSTEPPPQQRAMDAELMQSLRLALAQLPPQQGEVFCLRELNGLSYQEIAEETGMSADCVGVTLHRAKAALRELLVSACAAGSVK
jgi:RNA polymerase sigma-70 factor (ECF subfamily)